MLIGGYTGLGSYNEMPLGVHFEKFVSPYVGIGGLFQYSSYDEQYYNVGFSGRWNYTATTLAGYAAWHGDVFKVKDLDTFVRGGIGFTSVSSHWESNSGHLYPVNARSGGTTSHLLLQLNARYFINSNVLISGFIGTGIGTLGIGLDYLL